MVHIYNGILLSYKKRWNSAICSNMDEPWDCNAKGNKPVRKSWKTLDTTYMWDIDLKEKWTGKTETQGLRKKD